MISRFAITRALVAAIALALLTACSAMAAEPPTEFQLMLRRVILPKVKMDQMPIREAIAAIQAAAKANDPAGRSVNIFYIPAQDQDANTEPPSVTMEFDDIPLGKAIRYLALGPGLRYVVGPNAVMLYHKSRSPAPLALRAYTYPEGMYFFGGSDRDEDGNDEIAIDKDDIRGKIIRFLKNCGVNFDAAGAVTYNRATQRLLVYDTQESLQKIARILDEIVRQPTQVRVSLTVVEVTDPASSLQALPLGELSYKALMQLPPEQRRVLHRSSVVVASGEEVAVDDSQAATLDGETVRVHQSATIGATIQEDLYTTRLALQWSLAIDATGAEAGPRMRTALQTTVLRYDGQAELFAVHSQQRGDVRTALYLVLTPTVIAPNGERVSVAASEEEY